MYEKRLVIRFIYEEVKCAWDSLSSDISKHSILNAEYAMQLMEVKITISM